MQIFRVSSRSKTRINHTRVLALIVFVLLLLSGKFSGEGLAEDMLELSGLAGVLISAFGRAWTSVYIAGYKTGTLIDCGPYSVTRNPLYFFSLIGAIGIGLGSGSFLLLVLFLTLFALYYPQVIIREEEQLKQIHGDEFVSYMERVPRFFPKMSLYSEPDSYVVNTKQLRRAFVDASYFIVIYGVLQLIDRLHEAGILPNYFRIP